MAGDAVDHAQFAAGDELLLGGAVADGVEHVLVDRHDERLGLDLPERGGEVSAGMPGNVAALPFACLADQVVGVHGTEVGLHEAGLELLGRLEAEATPRLLLPELGGETITENARAWRARPAPTCSQAE